MTDDPLKRFRGDLDALVTGAGVDIHADPDVYATLTTLVRLVATHHDRLRERREQVERATREGV